MSTERNDCATELRQSSVSGNGKPQLSRRRFNPARIFIEKDRLAWFWFGFAMLVLVAAAFDRYYIVQSFKQRERIVVIDPANTFCVSPLLSGFRILVSPKQTSDREGVAQKTEASRGLTSDFRHRFFVVTV